jgi:hypothetical protein
MTIQSIANFLRTYAELTPTLGTSGVSREPILTLANDVAQRIFAQGMDWKWNRAYIPPFLTAALQQDYLTQVTNMGWMERGTRVDINNTQSNNNAGPKPVQSMNAVRELSPTAVMGNPVDLNYIPNSIAKLGTWEANTPYLCGYGVPQTPVTPIQQFMDASGNLLYIDSTVLGLNEMSPGYSGTPITLPSNSPYGISGSTKPQAATNSQPGTLVQDGTVIWTVADPNGIAVRLNPIPSLAGLCWLIKPEFQQAPPYFSQLQDTITPIPNDLAYLFRQGLRACLLDHASSPKAAAAMEKWLEDLMTALRAADREADEFTMYPSNGLMSGNGFALGNIGPAWPF